MWQSAIVCIWWARLRWLEQIRHCCWHCYWLRELCSCSPCSNTNPYWEFFRIKKKKMLEFFLITFNKKKREKNWNRLWKAFGIENLIMRHVWIGNKRKLLVNYIYRKIFFILIICFIECNSLLCYFHDRHFLFSFFVIFFLLILEIFFFDF